MKPVGLLLKIFPLTVSVMLLSCIRNDIPYPVVELAITSVQGDGFTCTSSDIDLAARTVVIHLDDTTDISNVHIVSAGFTEGASSDVAFPGYFDMRSDLPVILELYQKYEWNIRAEQVIERSFEVEGQIGKAEIDAERFIVRVKVPKGTDLNNIVIKKAVLGPEGITVMDPDPSEITQFETYRTITVKYHDFVEKWQIYVETTDIHAVVTSAAAGSRVMWLEGSGVPDTELGFRYRKAGTEEWTVVDAADLHVSGGSFSAYVGGLEPGTDYEVVAYSGENDSESVLLRTYSETALPNSGFEDWATIDNIVCPYLDVSDAFWGTGNPGAAIVSITLTDKTEDKRPGSSGTYGALLESKLAGIMGIGRFASGNIFTGAYLGTRGMNGLVGFGRPYSGRPTALTGWVKYTRGDITSTSSVQPPGKDIKVGDPDAGIIYVALGNWTPEEYGVSPAEPGVVLGTQDIPICVDTRDMSTVFDKNAEAVIGYGELLLGESVSEWTEFTINIEYRRFDVEPTHILIVCTSSMYGDYFIGSENSKMWIDDFKLLYDKI